ncbi:MAG: hypothetical protein EXX96DRAFT_541704 [Benjaminiella poitrasii]|nr:MAG: hypothetical protein EXX96DRAFT_541704 [Benjaminiella poitrasii]
MQARTSLDACIKLPSINHNKPIHIQITTGQNLKDLTQHLVQTNAIPPYLSPSIYAIIIKAINESCQRDQSSSLPPSSTLSKQELRHLFVDAYQSNTLQYNNRPEDDIFPRAYHTLVHCPIATIFDTLLELEQSYVIAIQELQTASDHELVAIQARQAQEIESASISNNESTVGSNLSNQTNANRSSTNSSNMTTIFTRQVEEMEIFQATWQSEIMQAQQTQRQEYREFVIELYREYQSRLASLSDEEHLKPEDTLVLAEKKLDGKEIVAAAANHMRKWEEQQQQSSNSIHSGNSSSNGSSSLNNNTISRPASVNAITTPTRPRTASFASSLGSPNAQQHTFSPNELASLVRTASLPSESNSLSVTNIQKMGFAKDQAEAALVLSNHHVETAITLLLENPTKVDAYLAEQRLQQQQLEQQMHFKQMAHPPASSTTPYYRRSHSLSQVPRPPIPTTTSSRQQQTTTKRRHSLQRFSTTPTFLNIIGNKNSLQQQQQQQGPPLIHAATMPNIPTTTTTTTNKGWNPISFLQQQKQAMENTNLSSVRKLGGWLGKAMENLGIENENNETRPYERKEQTTTTTYHAPQLVESFTIMMGTTQIKSSHNLRLLVTDVATDIFHPQDYDPAREMAYRAETATKLYTSHLSAIIVLVEISELMSRRQSPPDWRNYQTGKSHNNRALFERCQQSTDFHFPTIEQQLRQIEEDFGSHDLTEGSFFVTKHSNLPSTQVVFHLLIDSTAITSNSLSNRHPLITGLRNILKITTQYDISSLSIPLLLLPDRGHELATTSSDPQRSLWLQKRGEVVMKTIKGFLIENSRSGKRVQNEGLDRAESMGSGALRNIEFLLPSQAEVYAPHPISNSVNMTTTTTTTPAAALTTSTVSIDPSLENKSLLIPQEVEVAFQQFRSLLVNLFRTS